MNLDGQNCKKIERKLREIEARKEEKYYVNTCQEDLRGEEMVLLYRK